MGILKPVEKIGQWDGGFGSNLRTNFGQKVVRVIDLPSRLGVVACRPLRPPLPAAGAEALLEPRDSASSPRTDLAVSFFTSPESALPKGSQNEGGKWSREVFHSPFSCNEI